MLRFRLLLYHEYQVPFIGDQLHHYKQLFYVLTETWLDEHRDAEIQIDGYQIHRSDCSVKRTRNRGKERGGVAVYLRDDLTPLTKVLLRYSNGAVDVLVLHIERLNLALITIYRHPDGPNGWSALLLIN